MRSSRRLALILWTASLIACDGKRAPADDGKCANMKLLPGAATAVMSVTPGDQAPPQPLPVRCADSACLRADPVTIAVVQPDGSIWLEKKGEAPVVVPAPPRSPDAPAPDVAQHMAEPAGPKLPRELRTCGTTRAGGGLGWHIIRNDGDVWQRVEWSIPPTTPEVLALGPQDYPLARPDGSLCGWARQSEEREWQVHALLPRDPAAAPDAKPAVVVIAAEPNHEHPPAHCNNDGTVTLRVPKGVTMAMQADGTLKPAPAGPANGGPARILPVSGQGIAAGPGAWVDVIGADGKLTQLVLPDATDLAGNALPAGARRDRLSSVGDGKRMMLVAERFQLPDCTFRESLSLVDVETKAVRGLRGLLEKDARDVTFVRLSYALERFLWVEAEPNFIDVSG